MISPDLFERPGLWRWLGLASIFAIVLSPILPMMIEAMIGTS